MGSDEAVNAIQNLVQQVQLLASLHWLSNLQVLPCIPLGQPAAIDDVADISGLPKDELLRTIRVTSSAGFLQQPLPGYVKHTPLSIQLLKRPHLTDSIAFLCDAAVPKALRMGTSKHSLDVQKHSHQPVVCSISNVDHEGHLQSRLRRGTVAYWQCWQVAFDNAVGEVLSTLDWTSLGDATVVQVGTRSMKSAQTLANRNPNIHFIVQVVEGEDHSVNRISDPSDSHMFSKATPKFEIEARIRGALQPVHNAAVYILHLPDASITTREESLESRIKAEVQMHFEILRANPNSKLVIVSQVLPDPGSVERNIEITARFQDLFLMQMGGEAIPSMSGLKELLGNVGDERGRLVVSEQLFSRQDPVVVLKVKIEDFPLEQRPSRVENERIHEVYMGNNP